MRKGSAGGGDGKGGEKKSGKLKQRLTIYDVERITGFSRGSISRAFNNSPFINGETREKILKAAREIGYQPHPGARLIKAARTGRWGILLPGFSNPYYANLFEAFDKEARRHDTFLQLGLFHYDAAVTDALAGYWSSGEVDGIIVDAGAGPAASIAAVKQAGVPVLFLHGRPSDDYDLVHLDRRTATLKALKALQDLGHTRIAHVGIESRRKLESTSYVRWKAWHAKHGKGDPDSLSCFVPNSSDGGEQAWREFKARKVSFTAVLAFNDIIACGLIQAAREDGKQIPKHLSVIGYDDIDEGRRLGLTTVRHDLALGAKLALEQLERRREKNDGPSVDIEVPGEFVMRRSVGSAPK